MGNGRRSPGDTFSAVIPAKAGIHFAFDVLKTLGDQRFALLKSASRFRGDDGFVVVAHPANEKSPAKAGLFRSSEPLPPTAPG